MRRATQVHPAGHWPESETVASVTLDYDDRFRRRFRLVDDRGDAFMLDLANATRCSEGDGLALDGGGFIRICAADEAVVDLRCATPLATTRLAWHIGNRHVPLQVLGDGGLRIRADHVIIGMAEHLGATAEHRTAPFVPEDGAYAGESQAPAHSHAHGHAHEHDHGPHHGHDQGKDHGHDHGH